MKAIRRQLTVRGLMVVVLLAALGLAVVVEVLRFLARRARYEQIAAQHGRAMSAEARNASSLYPLQKKFQDREEAHAPGGNDPMQYLRRETSMPANRRMVDLILEQRNQSQFRWEWHQRMKEKYERAARSPWLAVEPDTPRPK